MKPAGKALEPAERALEPPERALEPAGRPFEASWGAEETDRQNGAAQKGRHGMKVEQFHSRKTLDCKTEAFDLKFGP